MDVLKIYGSAVFVTLAFFGIIHLIKLQSVSPEIKQARANLLLLVEEALALGKFTVLHRCMWFHPEGAGETTIKVHLYLSNGTTLFFDCYDWNDRYYLVDPTTGRQTDASELKNKKTSKAIVKFFWDYEKPEIVAARRAAELEKAELLKKF